MLDKGVINRIASGDLSTQEQLVLLKQIEASVLLQKEQEEVQMELDTLSQAADVIASHLKEHKSYVKGELEKVYSYVRQPGPKGDRGDAIVGPQGPKGDSIVGPAGVKGDKGDRGADGKDGTYIVDVYWAADGSLVCVLSDGREIDTGPLMGGKDGSNTSVSVSNWSGYSTEELKQTFIAHTFETVNKNLEASSGTLAYDANDDLVSITYANGVVKTLAYDAGGDLISVTLSGNTPEGIDLVKTFSYDANANLTDFVYS